MREDTRRFLVGFQKERFGPRERVIAIDFASFSATAAVAAAAAAAILL